MHCTEETAVTDVIQWWRLKLGVTYGSVFILLWNMLPPLNVETKEDVSWHLIWDQLLKALQIVWFMWKVQNYGMVFWQIVQFCYWAVLLLRILLCIDPVQPCLPWILCNEWQCNKGLCSTHDWKRHCTCWKSSWSSAFYWCWNWSNR